MKKLFTLLFAISCVISMNAQITETGNGFLESFDYADGTVFDDVEYEGAFVEWPENSSVQEGILTWDMGVEGEGSFGAELKDSMNLIGNANLKFKYKFPTDAFVDIYMIDSEGMESELSVTFVGGVDSLQEVTIDLSTAEGIDISKLMGFYIIFFTPTESTLSLDDVLLGDAELKPEITTKPITESGNGFLESFVYPDGTVFDDVVYEGAFVEWPENSSVQDGILTWDMGVEGEGSFGAELKDPMDLSGNTNLKFKYKFPADAFVDIYMIDSDGMESELSVTFTGGVDTLQEVTIDLSTAEGIDISKLMGFYIIFFTPTTSTLSLDDVLLGDAELKAEITTDPITGSGNGFKELFDYADGTVFDDVEYEGAFVEWPENSSVEGGILTWDMGVEGEGSFGAEFKDPMNLSGNTNLKFKYKFPTDAFVDIYMIDSDGMESELSVTFTGGVDTLQEATIDLSTAEGIDISKLMGFYIIFFTPTESTLSLDDVMLGDAIVATGLRNYTTENQFRIYPNPATTDIRITMDAEMISIYNMAGQVVYKENNYKMGSAINVSPLKEGLYIIKADKNLQKVIIR